MTAGLRRPESVLVVVHTETGEALLLERAWPRGFWQSVTGALEWGETVAAAAARELHEETGLPVAGLRDGGATQRFPILPAWRDRYAPEIDSNLEHVWYLELERPVAVQLNTTEHVDYVWLPLAEAIERASSWTNQAALRKLLAEQTAES